MAHYYRRGHVHGALESHGEAFRSFWPRVTRRALPVIKSY